MAEQPAQNGRKALIHGGPNGTGIFLTTRARCGVRASGATWGSSHEEGAGGRGRGARKRGVTCASEHGAPVRAPREPSVPLSKDPPHSRGANRKSKQQGDTRAGCRQSGLGSTEDTRLQGSVAAVKAKAEPPVCPRSRWHPKERSAGRRCRHRRRREADQDGRDSQEPGPGRVCVRCFQKCAIIWGRGP